MSQLRKLTPDQHPIAETDINKHALEVLKCLHQHGYRALLVGGCVRDLFLGKHPKDFDIATNATPEQIKALFRNSRIIGRRFRLVHIRFGAYIVEVATFRASPVDAKNIDQSGRLLKDNEYGSLEDDAMRRDFTVNALYYDIADHSVLDMANGLEDIKERSLCLIGDAHTRYREDPVRMLRAIRFAAKLDFSIDKKSAEPIKELAFLLEDIPAARLFDESVKLFGEGASLRVYHLLVQYGLLQQLFPQTHTAIQEADWINTFIETALENTDSRVKEKKPITPAFIYAVFFVVAGI